MRTCDPPALVSCSARITGIYYHSQMRDFNVFLPHTVGVHPDIYLYLPFLISSSVCFVVYREGRIRHHSSNLFKITLILFSSILTPFVLKGLALYAWKACTQIYIFSSSSGEHWGEEEGDGSLRYLRL